MNFVVRHNENFVMRLFLVSGTESRNINEDADVEPLRNGNRGYRINNVTNDSNGQNLLDELNNKIDELKRGGIIPNEYEITSVDSSEGFADELLPALNSTLPLIRIFNGTSSAPDGRIYLDVRLVKGTDKLVRKGGRTIKRTRKKVRNYSSRRHCKKLKRI